MSIESSNVLDSKNESNKKILELLEAARDRRRIDIEEAAYMARKPDDHLERDASYPGILAREVMSLHTVMMRLNRKRLIGRSAIQLERGRITHSPSSKFGNNHYSVSTPLILATDFEFVGDSYVTDGYIFRTYHNQRSQYTHYQPSVAIDRVWLDKSSGEAVKDNSHYIIHTYSGEDHPYATLSGTAIDADALHTVNDRNSELFEEPIGLIRLATETLLR
jgi:hypothetical protein